MIEQHLKEQMRSLYSAMITKDIQKLNQLLIDDYRLVHMTGYDQSKAEWLEQIADEQMRYYSAHEEQLVVKVNDNHASICAQYRVDARIYGFRSTWPLQLSSDMVKINDVWYFHHTTATTY